MKEKTDSIFIRVSSVYTEKNALEKQVAGALKELDNLLVENLFAAKLAIKQAIKQAEKDCPTTKRCKPLRTEYWSYTNESIYFRVNDVIKMALHPVYKK